jgi:hypothetical protein
LLVLFAFGKLTKLGEIFMCGGTYVDMAVNLPLVDPAKVFSPVLMTRGE